MEILFSNPYNMVFAGTVMIGVLMLALSLVAFLVLVLVSSNIHGVLILSRKAVTSVFSRTALTAKQPHPASSSANTTAGSVRPATTLQTLSANATTHHAGPRPAIPEAL